MKPNSKVGNEDNFSDDSNLSSTSLLREMIEPSEEDMKFEQLPFAERFREISSKTKDESFLKLRRQSKVVVPDKRDTDEFIERRSRDRRKSYRDVLLPSYSEQSAKSRGSSSIRRGASEEPPPAVPDAPRDSSLKRNKPGSYVSELLKDFKHQEPPRPSNENEAYEDFIKYRPSYLGSVSSSMEGLEDLFYDDGSIYSFDKQPLEEPSSFRKEHTAAAERKKYFASKERSARSPHDSGTSLQKPKPLESEKIPLNRDTLTRPSFDDFYGPEKYSQPKIGPSTSLKEASDSKQSSLELMRHLRSRLKAQQNRGSGSSSPKDQSSLDHMNSPMQRTPGSGSSGSQSPGLHRTSYDDFYGAGKYVQPNIGPSSSFKVSETSSLENIPLDLNNHPTIQKPDTEKTAKVWTREMMDRPSYGSDILPESKDEKYRRSVQQSALCLTDPKAEECVAAQKISQNEQNKETFSKSQNIQKPNTRQHSKSSALQRKEQKKDNKSVTGTLDKIKKSVRFTL